MAAQLSTQDIGVRTARIAAFENTIIPHQSLKIGVKRLERHHQRGMGKLKSRGLLIVGESRAGKTTLLKHYANKYPIVTFRDLQDGRVSEGDFTPEQMKIINEAELRRVLQIELKVRPSRRSIAGDILQALSRTSRDRQYSADMQDQIIHFATEMGTEILFIDEAHHAVNESNDESTEVLSEFFKSLENRVPFQIVYAGLPKLLNMERFKQFQERLVPRLELIPYNWQTRTGRIQFMALLGQFEKLLQLPEPSDLKSHDVAKRIYVGSSGEVGVVSKLLSEALSLAQERQDRAITLELLSEVYASYAPARESSPGADVIDFDEIIPDDESISAQAVDPADNPFLCADGDLFRIWAERNTKGKMKQSRSTGLRGTGMAPYSPLAGKR